MDNHLVSGSAESFSAKNDRLELLVRRLATLMDGGLKSLDRFIFPAAIWKWIGADGILYRRVMQQGDLTYVGEFSLDSSFVEKRLGTFGKECRVGALPCKGGYFYPVVGEALRYEELVRVGCSDREALRLAREGVIVDMERAQSFGKTWFAYVMAVKAKRGNVVCAEAFSGAFFADPVQGLVNPVVDRIFRSLVAEVEIKALQAADLESTCSTAS